MNEKQEFLLTFQISKKIVFDVCYYTLGNNKSPYFTTSAAEFNQPKTDYRRCGQSQNSLLHGNAARAFFDKWNKFHLHDLTKDQYDEMVSDVEKLKDRYNYIEKLPPDGKVKFGSGDNTNISFYRVKELSMMELKKYIPKNELLEEEEEMER